jgi:hypothetical protein
MPIETLRTVHFIELSSFGGIGDPRGRGDRRSRWGIAGVGAAFGIVFSSWGG